MYLACTWLAYQLAIDTLWDGFDVALMWLWVALPAPPPFDVGCWMFDVGCSGPKLAFGVRHPSAMRDFHAFVACWLGVG
jgi:hypothetical protein